MGFAEPFVIKFEVTENGKLPYSVFVDENDTVTSGLGDDDGATFMGFGPRNEQRVTVTPAEARDKPALAVGLVATFAYGSIFAWDIPVKSFGAQS